MKLGADNEYSSSAAMRSDAFGILYTAIETVEGICKGAVGHKSKELWQDRITIKQKS